MRLHHASEAHARWLADTLAETSAPFGAAVVAGDGVVFE